ncbi:hypothetical protein PT974_06001 [Cladobotryum mycophilum]|uniref:ubiquitinyl hydrolase 1 n=1 Tax=Cladobotryum mycophilum TaxID=491253 RepID=A0ABR0SKA2_9HYPO
MDLLRAVFDHVVLPAKLPGCEDSDPDAISQDLLHRLIRACETLTSFAEPPWAHVFQSLRGSLRSCMRLNQGRLEKNIMLQHFQQLKPRHSLILHVVEQNAALIVRRQAKNGQDLVIFEAFETSPSSEQVLAAENALVWDFPGRSVQVPFAELNEAFLDNLTTFLEQASMEAIPSLQAQTQKANVSVVEVRDTTDPALITQMLMPLLEAVGEYANMPKLRKRVRDDINFSKGDLPWRRLPFWLVLRVAAQRHLSLTLGDGRLCYKLLMCIFLAHLLKDSTSRLDPELIITLRAKLCRRMAKLEMVKHDLSSTVTENFNSLFTLIQPLVNDSVQQATLQVENVWESFKRRTTRRVPKFPLRAPRDALTLSLPNSGRYLDSLLATQYFTSQPAVATGLPKIIGKSIEQVKEFTDHNFRITALEWQIEHEGKPKPLNVLDARTRCIQLAGRVDEYLAEIGSMYDSDPVQLATMVLNLLDLFVQMDECAVEACRMLRDYRPVFPPQLLDSLLLSPQISSMTRLYKIQSYLMERCSVALYNHILSDVGDINSLAVRYVDSSTEMRNFMSRIDAQCQLARQQKEAEWKRVTAQYDKHTEGLENGTCVCSWKNNQRDVKGCTKCWHWRSRKRLEVKIHEDFLPSQPIPKATVVFELAIPGYISAYRNATWRILKALEHPAQSGHSAAPNALLQDCGPLKQFKTASSDYISLASFKKCFQQTHYKFKKGKISLQSILLPFAAQFELFDQNTKTWVEDVKVPPSLHHICGVHIPHGLENIIRPAELALEPNYDGPSSYSIQANQTECPSNMSIAEFSAYQKLLSGTTRRWRNIAVELGSSNLNFSSSDATQMLAHLAVQAGPQLKDGALRAVHIVFTEPEFVERLAEQIDRRLNSIMANWRETSCMELLIILCLKLFSLSSGSMRRQSETLLKTCRNATLTWITSLRKAFMDANDGDAADRIATYAFKAALLCRLTFEVSAETKTELGAEDLASWVQASVALQQNLVDNIDKLPKTIKSMMIRDAKLAYHMERLLRLAVAAHPGSIGKGISSGWQDTANPAAVSFSNWKFLQPPDSRWVHAYMFENRGGQCNMVSVQYNVIEGHLLMDGKPRGKLPAEMRNDLDVKYLFGNKHLLTYSTSIPNMAFRLATQVGDQTIYFGSRGNQTIIQAERNNEILEFIPQRVFTGPNNFDLPASLLDNCAHWLNLTTGTLEIRRESSWFVKMRDWSVNVRGRYAQRGDHDKSNLVDPQSEVFQIISKTFQHFVDPRKLTVYQPLSEKGKLSVEMKHLDLAFYVNKNGFLCSGELKAEVDPNQDLGTWYGLDSKIVLRDVADRKRRSVIIPLGKPICQRHDFHTSVRLSGAEYGRFEIDDVLGRLTCAPEPRFVYTKAFCHALTSFCLPDTLTGRTGTEEAFNILRSGAAQPWIPLVDASHSILRDLADEVLPKREYYPRNLKRLQKVVWSNNVAGTVQHDGYESIIREIETKSNMLKKFSTPEAAAVRTVEEPSHLRHRGKIHRQLYERPTLDPSTQVVSDTVYSARDDKIPERANKVYRVAHMIHTCSGIYLGERKLVQILESSDLIGGFNNITPMPNSISLINQIEDSIDMRLGDLISFCRSVTDEATPIFTLSLLAFGPHSNLDLITLLVGFSCIQGLKNLDLPTCPSFADFRSRGPPSLATLESQIALAYLDFEYRPSPNDGNTLETARIKYERMCKAEGRNLAQLIGTIRPDWIRRRRNEWLARFIDQTQAMLPLTRSPKNAIRLHRSSPGVPFSRSREHKRTIPSLSQDLILKVCPSLGPLASPFLMNDSTRLVWNRQEPREITELERILKRFGTKSDTIRQDYSKHLLRSLESLRRSGDIVQPIHESTPEYYTVANAIDRALGMTASHLRSINVALSANDHRYRWLKVGNLWPDVGPIGMLELLQSKSDHDYGAGMKAALVTYGYMITHLQRLRRIRLALGRKDMRVVTDELQNKGHENWSPLEMPNWLLLEIESDILIRPDQVEVATAIIDPASGKNSVLQMNMGKGKTSIIMPMAAAILADGKRLVRLIVPKPLLMQTAQTTQSRLGGLLGREVRHIPFSRQTPTTKELLHSYQELHMDIFKAGGVILTSHEYILSYKLSGLQRLADNKLDQASKMIGFQNWMETKCRDILDESDFTLAVKTQLNYPSGSEMPVDGHPFRWQVIEDLLALVAHKVPELKSHFPRSLEILGQPGWFPMMQFLKSDVEDEIYNCIINSICAGQALFLRPAKRNDPQLQQAIRRVLCEEQFDSHLYKEVTAAYAHPESAAKKLLINYHIVSFQTLECSVWASRRGYPVAVPYESRDTPSERAEWGHPDVAIVFTCLSFYFSGLTHMQFHQGLQHILTSEDPASQYERWISESITLPEALHHWNVINMDDEGQVQDLWKHLNKSRIVVNHYLNTFVFPLHARQFSVKLQASAWDIPILSHGSNQGTLTTGFSGTSDNLLPLTIEQADLPSLSQTNAEVLSYLLQTRNRRYKVATDMAGKRLSEEELLKRLLAQKIHILIDAGAYVIEMSNEKLARLWLTIDHKSKAAVYFGKDNRAWVMFRDKTKRDVPLLATPFVNRLEECVVYLDEAHTRGVDLKFPETAVAALTLSLKQTKDYTVQAAMRLRQLKTTQSIVFFAPPEVDGSIRDVCGLATTVGIDSSNVVFWLLEQTCRTKEDVLGLYIAQGLDFCKRKDAILRYSNCLSSSSSKSKLLDILREPEHQTLEQLYGESSANQSLQPLEDFQTPHLQDIADKLFTLNRPISHVKTGALEEVEQEREVELQLESVREVQKPVRYKALGFSSLHVDIIHFAKTGKLQWSGAGFEHVFEYIAKTELGKKFGVRHTGSRLFVSKEFGRTVELAKGNEKAASNFLRPVEWILWCPSTETGLVIIPEEAEQMIPRLRPGAKWADKLKVHLIAYSAPVTRAMAPFNEFRYYVLPPLPAEAKFPDWFKIELGILAGRLYVDYSEWSTMAKYLHSGDEWSQCAEEGTSRGNSQPCFTDNPVDFLLEWLGLRRKAQDVLNTPVGFICMGRTVAADHPFFMKSDSSVSSVSTMSTMSTPQSEKWKEVETDEEVGSEIEWSEEEEYEF